MRVDIEKWITTTFRRGNKRKKDKKEEKKDAPQAIESSSIASAAPSTSSLFSRKSKSSKKSDKLVNKKPEPAECSEVTPKSELVPTQSCSNLSDQELPSSGSSSTSSYVEDIIIEQHFEVEQKLYQFNGPLSEFTSCMDQAGLLNPKPIPIDCLNINARNIEIKPTKFRITYAGLDTEKPQTTAPGDSSSNIGSIILPITNYSTPQEPKPANSQIESTQQDPIPIETTIIESNEPPVPSNTVSSLTSKTEELNESDQPVEKSIKSDIISKEAASPPVRKTLVNETSSEDHMDRYKPTRSSLASVETLDDTMVSKMSPNESNLPCQTNHAMWLDLSASLNQLLNGREESQDNADVLIDDIIKLEAYLNNELDLHDHAENDMFFSGPDQIMDHINKAIKIKLFRLSQSTSLFEELKKKIIALLSSHLDNSRVDQEADQVECLRKFEHLEKSYLNLYDTLKSRLKLKMSRLERFIDIWNEFDLDCRHLDDLFSISGTQNAPSSLEYQSRLIEISGYVNKLLEQRGQLTSICDEKRYFELRNRIMAYEQRLEKLRSDHEKQEQQSKLNDIPATTSTPLAVAPQQNTDSSASSRESSDESKRQRRLVLNTTSNASTPFTADKITAESLTRTPANDLTLQRIPLEIRINHNHFTTPPPVVPSSSNQVASHHHVPTYINHYANEYYDNVDSPTGKQYDVFVPHCVSPITEVPQEDLLEEDNLKSPPNQQQLTTSANRIPTPPYPYLVDRSNQKLKPVQQYNEYRKPETSNKATWTINDMSTQTDTPVVSVGVMSDVDNQIEEQPVRLVSLSTTPIKSSNKENVIKLTRGNVSNKKTNSTNKQQPAITHTYLARNQLESDGKKLLLEAYLRNNNNTSNQTSDSRVNNNKSPKTNDLMINKQSPAPSSTEPKKKQSRPLSARIVDTITSSTITHGESGIGTGTNDDEEQDSLESMLPGEEDDDDVDDEQEEEYYEDQHRANIYEIHQMMYSDQHNNIKASNNSSNHHHGHHDEHDDADESASDEVVILTSASSSNRNQQQTGLTDELYVNINCKKLTKKGKGSKEASKLKSVQAYLAAPITSSSASSSLTRPPVKRAEPLLLKQDMTRDENFNFKKEQVKMSRKFNDQEPAATASSLNSKLKAAASVANSIFWRLLAFFVFFIVPLLLVLAGYLIYAIYLNPTCCDFERTYLFINVT